MRLPRWLVRETVLSRPGVGSVYLHTTVLRPTRLRAMAFQAEDWPVPQPVPRAAWDAVDVLLGREDPPVTSAEIMQAIGRAGESPSPQ